MRVLHVTEKLQAGGIESFIMNIYRNIDREKVQFDFLVTREEKEFYDEEIQALGGKKYVINKDKNQSTFKRVYQESKELEKFLKNNSYDIIHIHSGTPLRILYLKAAKKAGVKVRIYHSHSAQVKGPHQARKIKKIVFTCIKQFFSVYASHYFACSVAAAQWMYPKRILKDVKIIHNGIDIEKFSFNNEIRKEYRTKMNLNDNFVIGHIGRFNEQKNHTFLIDVFNALYNKNKKAKLLLIGDGELKKQIEEKVKRLKLENAIFFLGIRDDVNNIMQAMDVFVLPSNYEGLPVVGIEAQATGIKCVFSNNITEEVVITQNTKMLPIEDSIDKWVETIESMKGYKRQDTLEMIRIRGYDIKEVAKNIEEFYLNEENKL